MELIFLTCLRLSNFPPMLDNLLITSPILAFHLYTTKIGFNSFILVILSLKLERVTFLSVENI